MGLIQGDLAGIDLRRDLELVLRAAAEAQDPRPLIDALAETDPIALAEVVCGPRSPGGPALVRAALRHTTTLEQQLTPRGAWGRLAELAGTATHEVIGAAALQHASSSWLWSLSRKVERERMGAIVLTTMADRPGFYELCQVAAAAGAREGLVIASATGRPEPAMVLLSVDRMAAVRAAATAIEVDYGARTVPWLAAAWGPEPDELFLRIVPHLRTRGAARAFAASCASCVQTNRLVRAVAQSLP